MEQWKKLEGGKTFVQKQRANYLSINQRELGEHS